MCSSDLVLMVERDAAAARALQANAEVSSGVTVKAINARSVVLSDRGAERELTLPAYAAQEGALSNAPGRSPEPQQQVQPAQPPQQQRDLEAASFLERRRLVLDEVLELVAELLQVDQLQMVQRV